MVTRILVRTAQVSANTPAAGEAYNFTGSSVSPLSFSFASRGMTTGETIPYYADNGTGQYERGVGTWNAAEQTLTRTTLRESSTGSLIDWSGSAPTVWSDGYQPEDIDAIAGGGTVTCTASEALTVGPVDLWKDSGVLKARKANASAVSQRPCDGFVTRSYALGATDVVVHRQAALTGLSGLTPGAEMYLGKTAGTFTHDVSAYVTGDYIQQLGVATSATTAMAERQTGVEIA